MKFFHPLSTLLADLKQPGLPHQIVIRFLSAPYSRTFPSAELRVNSITVILPEEGIPHHSRSTLIDQALIYRASDYRPFFLSSFLIKLYYYISDSIQVLILDLLIAKINSHYSVRDSP